jgi:hypothetical protein
MDKFQQYEHNWLACMERIGRKEAECFENDNVSYTEQIITLNSRRNIMCQVYCEMKKHKKIVPIESLDEEDKKQLWKFTIDICADKIIDRKRRIEVLKTFYVLEYFLNNK